MRGQSTEPIEIQDVRAGHTIRAEFLGYMLMRPFYVDAVIDQDGGALYVEGRWVRQDVYTDRTFPYGPARKMKVTPDSPLELLTPGATP